MSLQVGRAFDARVVAVEDRLKGALDETDRMRKEMAELHDLAGVRARELASAHQEAADLRTSMVRFQKDLEARHAEATLKLHKKLKAALRGWRESDAALTRSEARGGGEAWHANGTPGMESNAGLFFPSLCDL